MGHLFHIHPLIVHFPIALFITALGLEVLSLLFKKELLHQIALCNYILGILGSVAAVLAAWLDAETLKHYVFYTHRALAYSTTSFALASGAVLLFVRNKPEKLFRILFVIFLLVISALVSITGFYGGRLVYEYGVGVAE